VFQVHPVSAEFECQLLARGSECRAHACRRQESCPHLPQKFRLRRAGGYGKLFLIILEAVTDFDLIAVAFAYALALQLAEATSD
jgi:hypothetical protein